MGAEMCSFSTSPNVSNPISNFSHSHFLRVWMHKTHVVQMVIYEAHRDRERGEERVGRGGMKKEVLKKWRKQSPLVW